jgi:membrane fusion protein, multidrug efflux system
MHAYYFLMFAQKLISVYWSPTMSEEILMKIEESPPVTSKLSPHFKRLIGMLLLGVGGIFAGIKGWDWLQFNRSHVHTDNCVVVAHLYPISSRIAGTVKTLAFEDNRFVKQGQKLVALDERDYRLNLRKAQTSLEIAQNQSKTSQATITQAERNTQAAIEQATANIQGAEANFATLQAAVTDARAGLNASQSQLSQVELQLKQAAHERERGHKLVQEGVISVQKQETLEQSYANLLSQRQQVLAQIAQSHSRIQQAQNNLGRAKAQIKSSQGSLSQASAGKTQVLVNQRQYKTTQSALQQAQWVVEESQNQLADTQITAPANGYIGKRSVELGQRVQAGQSLLSLVSEEIWLVANLKETEVAQIQPGQTAEIHLDAFPTHPFKGRVDSLAPGTGSLFSLLPADNATGNFTKIVQHVPVKIIFDPQSLKDFRPLIAPGMSAFVSIAVKDHANHS